MIVRDPIHGDIELTDEERLVLDTAVMQRLRFVKQLGTAFLVYPGCTHTRFDHSLGTLSTATRIIAALRRRGHRITQEEKRIIRMAALLHDIGHIPYGHTFEDERKVFDRHDSADRMRSFILESEVGDKLSQLGMAQPVFEALTKPLDWRGQIVSSTLDADLLDYLRRDSYFAGLSQGYDDRIFSYFCIEGDQLAVDLTKNGLERFDARSEIIHLLRLRYFLTERVYFHHAKVISGAMISKALELALTLGVTEEDLYTKGDETLLQYFEDTAQAAGAESAASGILHLVQSIKSRQLYKRAYALTYDETPHHEREMLIKIYHASFEARRQLEEAIAKEAGLPSHHVIVYCPARTALKEASVLARLPHGTCRLNEAPGRQMELDALREQYVRIWRFWVFARPGYEQVVGQAAERVLNIPNVLHRLPSVRM